MDMSKYLSLFVSETSEHLQSLNENLSLLQKDPKQDEAIAACFRNAHSIKGMASALSLEKIASLSHAMEKWCKEFQQDTVEPQPRAIQLIFQGGDLLRLLVARMDEIGCAEDRNLYDTLISQFRKGPDALAVEVDTGAPPQLSNRSSAEGLKYVRVKYSLIEA